MKLKQKVRLYTTKTAIKEDVEPCVFVHFAADNIKEKSLMEVLNSDFFKGFRKRQPYTKK